MRRLAVVLFASSLIGPAAHAEDQMDQMNPAVTAGAAHLTVDAPIATLLAKGAVVIPFHSDLTIAAVFGPGGLAVRPPIGHLHVTLDDAAWHWVHAGADPLVIQGLAPGAHTVRVDLADPTHKVVDTRSVTFIVPTLPQTAAK
jgi:Family of unknown function (DUF6130)